MSRLLKGLVIGGALSSAIGLRVYRDRQLMKDPNNFKHVWFKTPAMADLALKTDSWNFIYVPKYYHGLLRTGYAFESIYELRKTTDNLIAQNTPADKDKICELFRAIANNFDALSTWTDKRELIRNLSNLAYRDGYINDISKYATEQILITIFLDFNSTARTDIIKSFLPCVPKKIITQRVHDSCFEMIFTGKEYNEYFGHIKKFKVLNANKNHHDFQYQEGLNVDTKEFDPKVSCYAGLYFTTRPEEWYTYNKCNEQHCHLARVFIPDETIVKIESSDKCKAKIIELKEIKELELQKCMNK